MSKTDLITLKDPNEFQLKGITIDTFMVDGHINYMWVTDGIRKYMLKGHFDICVADSATVLDISTDD